MPTRAYRRTLTASFILGLLACSKSSSAPPGTMRDAGIGPDAGGPGIEAGMMDGAPTDSRVSPPPDGAPRGGDSASDASPSGPPATCTPPASPADTSQPTAVVGTGAAASCTEAALASAVASGGIVTFNCGPSPTTIAITTQIELSTTADTVIDGGGTITLDGSSSTRILHLFNNQSAGVSEVNLTLQNLTFVNGKASGTAIPASSQPNASTGTMTDGGGGALWVRDAFVSVFNCTFKNNMCATSGPDVAGGAIYSIESTGTTIIGSTFIDNSGSNGGAIGLLNSSPVTLVNDTFAGNTAVGTGGNSFTTYEMGSGGSGGAIYMDGSLSGTVTLCGDTFEHHTANDVGGVIFRVDEGTAYPMTIDRCTFDNNSGAGGAGAFYLQQLALTIVSSTFSNNATQGEGGAGRIEGNGTFSITNTTFASNTATDLSGALALNGGSGTITNVTFANNSVTGGSGKFAAAIGGSVAPTVSNTVFSNDTTMDSGSPMQCWFSPFPGTGNVQWPKDHVVGGSPDSDCTTNITFGDPMLGALGNNGGPTETLVPASASAASGIGVSCPTTDQRGNPRPMTGCTAGAVEIN